MRRMTPLRLGVVWTLKLKLSCFILKWHPPMIDARMTSCFLEVPPARFGGTSSGIKPSAVIRFIICLKWEIAKVITTFRETVLTSPTMTNFYARWGIDHHKQASKNAKVAVKPAETMPFNPNYQIGKQRWNS